MARQTGRHPGGPGDLPPERTAGRMARRTTDIHLHLRATTPLGFAGSRSVRPAPPNDRP
ncbi:MAG: hypothetical protein AVDCRST_MAG33-2167 [uncultured Thermomicrobiales bacterium]|uniref:Uncharacterized protein n=1 Tax=uncultured Thermomicrobiales bacterium TaxID=1645740 RepID=A0A6J4V536_9BACT|nr:MAG: hypothetical protein AVDCRST_MAG33-2167 [uncultured Thermomicrobiales bacterium]